MSNRHASPKFIILDDNHQTIASAVLVAQQGQHKRFELTSAPTVDLASLPALNILSLNSTDFVAWRGSIERMRDDQLYFLAEEQIDPHLRRHLRITMSFRAFLFPASGELRRHPVICKNISCGGIALYSQLPMRPDQLYQIALPCTEPPILVNIQVLRQLEDRSGAYLYACQFVDLLPQEEAMIQECIFEYDLHHHSA